MVDTFAAQTDSLKTAWRGRLQFFDGFDQTFVGLYLHMTEGGIVRVGTFGSVDQAEEAASKLACKHDWPIYNFIR